VNVVWSSIIGKLSDDRLRDHYAFEQLWQVASTSTR